MPRLAELLLFYLTELNKDDKTYSSGACFHIFVCRSKLTIKVLYIYLTHLGQVDFSTLTLWTDPFPIKGNVWLVLLLLPCFIEIPVLNANIVDSDQMPSSAESDLGLHCLHMSLVWDARH